MPQSLRSVSSRKRSLNRGEERLLGILHHLRDLKEIWESKSSSESRLKDLQKEIEKIEEEIQKMTQNTLDRALSIGEAFQKSKSTFLAAGAATSIIIGISLNANSNTNNKAGLFYLLGAGAGITAVIRTNGTIIKSKEALNTKNEALKALNAQLSASRKNYSSLSKNLRANNINLPQLTFGTALLPLTKIQTLNKSFLVNESRLIKPAELQTLILRDLTEESVRSNAIFPSISIFCRLFCSII